MCAYIMIRIICVYWVARDKEARPLDSVSNIIKLDQAMVKWVR